MAIEVKQLSKVYETGRRRSRRRVEAVNELSFGVERGERVSYIGPDGAGKPTSIKILTRILHPTHGEATVLGVVPWVERRHLAAHPPARPHPDRRGGTVPHVCTSGS